MALLTPRTAYDLWAGTYPAMAHNPLMRTEQEVVAPLLAQVPAQRALDVGTGSGRYVPLLKASGATEVLSLDFSLAMLARGSGPARVCGDACRLPFRRAAFDLINASLMVGDIADLRGWAFEMARVLRTGGHLVYSDFHPSWARRGWSRTFRSAEGERHSVSFHAHTIEEHQTALKQARFHVLAIREPRLSAHGGAASRFRALLRRWDNPQVLVVFHAVKEP